MEKSVLDDVLSRPQVCARRAEGECSGRITIEHAFGRKYEAPWNCVILCYFHHLGQGLNKELNRYIAYRYATEDDLKKFKCYEQLKQEKSHLRKKYAL